MQKHKIHTNSRGFSEDRLHFGFQILSFFIPIVAAILYFKNKEQYPLKAKAAKNAGIIGLLTAICLQFLLVYKGSL